MSLTPKERIKAYEKAWELINNDKETFICHALNSFHDNMYKVNAENFPEFFLFQPTVEECCEWNCGVVWFNVFNHSSNKFGGVTLEEATALRLAVLEICIDIAKEATE